MNAVKEFAIALGDNLVNLSTAEFFESVRSIYYPDIEIEFMYYFLELANQEDLFVVHYAKLTEYGIMQTDDTAKLNVRLVAYGLIARTDYLITKVSSTGKKEYMLTPNAFKRCLMRSKRRPTQTVDPFIYVNYYIILEKVQRLHALYERTYAKKMQAMNEDCIEQLQTTISNLTEQLAQDNMFDDPMAPSIDYKDIEWY